MEKGFAFLLTGVVCAGVALVAVACDDSESSTFPGGGVDASTDSPPGFGSSGNTSSSGTIGEGGTPGAKCEPVIADDYKANWTAPTPPNESGPCSTTLIGTYYDECIGSLGKPDHKTRCDAWKSANTTCGNCIEPTNNTGPIQWHRNRFYLTINVAGCIAIQQNKYGENDCGFAYGAAINCTRDACSGCFETGKSTFADFQTCQSAAATKGLCASLRSQQSTICGADGGGVATAPETKGCFNENNLEPEKTHYTRLIGYFCGQ